MGARLPAVAGMPANRNPGDGGPATAGLPPKSLPFPFHWNLVIVGTETQKVGGIQYLTK